MYVQLACELGYNNSYTLKHLVSITSTRLKILYIVKVKLLNYSMSVAIL